MKKIIKSIALAIIVLGGFNAFAQVPNGGQVHKSRCSVSCLVGECSIECTSSSSAGGALATCTCFWGFASCTCGGGGGTVTANPTQMLNLGKLINHLEGYNSVAGVSLKGKVIFYRSELLLNHNQGLSTVVNDIITTIESLNVVEKSNLNNFISSLSI